MVNMNRGLGKLIDISFKHKKTGTLCPRYYLIIPVEVVKDEKFPLEFSDKGKKGKVLITITEDGKLIAEPM